ncbi:MAG TPA: bifunctional acetate--CoA ligase family protein/GNAT family N-acetyltransferase [Gammaproteobacteria bacterium]|nr:bifunctional acetate--CoA ligase family protein/GNAT family N-acetyltransferase [Gammaproteobacteria bacterium]
MTIRNLEYMFAPRSVAVIGASDQADSLGTLLVRNLLEAGFGGRLSLVNPRRPTILGQRAYTDVAQLPEAPDLAVICTPAATVPGIVGRLAETGTRAAVVAGASFAKVGGQRGQALQKAMLDAARPHLMRIIGPNCQGILVPGSGLNASLAHIQGLRGRLAFVAQSGTIASSMLDWATSRGIGFSHLVSLGDMADVDFGDMLDYLANDRSTQAILLYIERITHARKFMSAARAAARSKPVIVVKSGRFGEPARPATTHSNALAASDAVYDAAFRRAGMLRVDGFVELFEAVELLDVPRRPPGDRMAILTNSGGMGLLASDTLMQHEGHLAELSPETMSALDGLLPDGWSRANPVDMIADATGERYRASLELLCEDRGVDAVLVIHCPSGMASGEQAAREVLETLREKRRTPMVLTSWVGDDAAEQARSLFRERHIPTFDTPEQAARSLMYMVRYRRNQTMLMETPASVPEEFVPELERAGATLREALQEGREWLNQAEAKQLLQAYGLPVVTTRTAGTPEEAAELSSTMETPVVLKILSPDITHKSEVDGVALDLAGPGAVREAAEAMAERVAEFRPDARLDGFTVEPMIRRAYSHELLLGATLDPVFGPVVVFGHGGTAAQVINDKVLAFPPLNMHLAREAMSRTRVWNLMRTRQGKRRPVDLDLVALAWIRIAQVVSDLPEIAEIDINPLLVGPDGVLALDARVRVVRTEGGTRRLAIRPYPKDLEEDVPLPDGRVLFLRPIRPEDEPALHATFAKLTPEEIRLRFFVPFKTLSHVMAARFTQIDYDREMALVLTHRGVVGRTELYGIVSINADPDNERAEYAIIIRRDMSGQGLGRLLMRRIIDYARRRGIREVYGEVLAENSVMLKICKEFGFRRSFVPGDAGVIHVSLEL